MILLNVICYKIDVKQETSEEPRESSCRRRCVPLVACFRRNMRVARFPGFYFMFNITHYNNVYRGDRMKDHMYFRRKASRGR